MDEESESLDHFNFTWTIENYFAGFKKVAESIKSPKFYNKQLGGKEFYLNLYPIGDGLPVEGYISCYLWRQSSGNDIIYKLDIIDINRKVCFSKTVDFPKRSEFSGIQKTVQLNSLMGRTNCTTFTLRLLISLKNVKEVFKKRCIVRSKFVLDKYSYMLELKAPLTVQRRNFCFNNKNFDLVIDVLENTFKIIQQADIMEHLKCMKCEFSLLDNKGLLIETKTLSHIFSGNNNALHIPAFFKDNELFANECSKNDLFTLKCDIFFPNGLFSSNVEYIETETAVVSSLQYNNSTCHEFERMYVDKIFSDVKFRIGDEILLAHKNVLALRSPVFLAMFSQNMSEKDTGVVNVSDVDLETFDAFLKYFYARNVDNMNEELALRLVVLADKYQVISLLETCSNFLGGNLTEENVLDILLTADAIQQYQLKKLAIGYIKLNAANILKTNQWQECIKNNIHLSTEVLMQITSDLNNYFHTL